MTYPLRTDYNSTGDAQTAAEMDNTNALVNANYEDIQPVVINTISKSSAYSAQPSDFVICDASLASFTVTLPDTPVDKTRISVKKIDPSSNTVTVAVSGASSFNTATGPTSIVLSSQNGLLVLHYDSDNDVWYVINTESAPPISSLAIEDDSFTIQDDIDSSKKAKFQASGISTSTTRTYTLPDADTTLAGTDNAQTLTDTRVNPRVNSQASTASLTIDADTTDLEIVSALAAAMTINAPSGTHVEGQSLLIRIKDDGTARALTWNAIWEPIDGVTLPTTTVIGSWHYIGAKYNDVDNTWDVLAVGEKP